VETFLTKIRAVTARTLLTDAATGNVQLMSDSAIEVHTIDHPSRQEEYNVNETL
jgi:hypothetical protein